MFLIFFNFSISNSHKKIFLELRKFGLQRTLLVALLFIVEIFTLELEKVVILSQTEIARDVIYLLKFFPLLIHIKLNTKQMSTKNFLK